MKKSLRLLTGILLSLFCAQAYGAALKFNVDNIMYTVIDEEAKTVKTTWPTGSDPDGNKYPKYTGDVVIPASVTYNDVVYTVTEIGEFTFMKPTGSDGLKSVVLPETITKIGNQAFQKCIDLTGLTIPASCKVLGAMCFSGCSAITSITIPDGVETIGNQCFVGTSLEELVIPNSVTLMGDAGLASVATLKKLVIGNGVTKIPNHFISDCTGLTDLTIGNSVEIIGSLAFSGCSGLTTIHLPASVKQFMDRSLILMSNLESFTVAPESPYFCAVDGILYSKDKLTLVKVPMAFDIQGYQIPSTVEHIGTCGFERMYNLTQMKAPAALKTIGKYGFWECKNMTTFDFGNCPLEHLEEGAFTQCEKLDGIKLPNTCTTLDFAVFYNNFELKNIDLGTGLVTMDDNIFDGCKSLKEVTLPASLETVGSNLFANCTSFENIYVAEGNTKFCAEDGILFSKDKTQIYIYPATKSYTQYTVPATVKNIYFACFEAAKNLETLDTGENTENIESYAFKNCTGLKQVTFGPKLTHLGEGVLLYCDNIERMYVKAVTPPASDSWLPASLYETCLLYVPQESLDTYKATHPWNRIENIIGVDYASTETIAEETLAPAISTADGILKVTGAESVSVYTLSGSQVYSGDATVIDTLPAGLYIVKAGDTVAKIRL